MSCDKFSDPHKQFLAVVTTVSKLTRFFEAVANPKWCDAMKLDIDVEKNKTWDIVSLPQGKRTLGSKGIYRIKYKVDGSIEHFNVSLVIHSGKVLISLILLLQ